MTLIKCFTRSHINNIAACLQLMPEKLILVGDGTSMEEPVRRYRRLLQQRKSPTAVCTVDTSGKDFAALCRILCEVVTGEEDPVIDLTGGDESAIMAVGAVLAQLSPHARQKIRVEKFDRKACCMLDCLQNTCLPQQSHGALRVEELIALHGGALHTDSYQPPAETAPKDLDSLWQIVSKDPKGWNRAITVLGEFERYSKTDDKMRIRVDLRSCNISGFPQKEEILRKFLEQLHHSGIVVNRSSRDYLEYTYTGTMERFCTQKAGNVLELKTLLEGRSALENGVPFFQDCLMSVNIDWDGILYDRTLHIQETRNEIDVVLMHGCTPIFISCKNGQIGDEELYKLHTVAQRFGGPHAGKMLIATNLDRKSDAANSSFAQRAWDMDIFLVTDAAELTAEQWKECFKSAML